MNDPLYLAADLARRFEGLRLQPYVCPAGYWTIGYGNRALADGTAVGPHTKAITETDANEMLMATMASLQEKLRNMIIVPLSAGKEAALLDFQFNLGTEALRGSTLRKLLNAALYVQAGAQLKLWNHIHKDGHLVASPGLTARRKAEWLLWSGAKVADALSEAPPPNPTDRLNAAELGRLKESS
ncbi:lysozyme [Acetobacter sicerae]|uniref:Lysozyme n=1 Tax=Acetobacter sicerae TaxID=85325 RepID=A0ABS8VRX8_9PROT|nr:lysozyme [Acetobacter sicerae]MCE0743325.1 lysozyme [Acetobacter sicerae]